MMKRVVIDQFYMDDLNESARDSDEVLKLKSNLTDTLQKGKFVIRKWQ